MEYLTETAVVFSTIIVVFAPALVAGSVSNEVDKIKVIFHNMLLEETGLYIILLIYYPEQEQEIQKVIKYIDARPFKFSVLGIIPMDANFPMIVVNLSITYIIVVLQFTHLY
ncbi:uncharacterized protein LOC128199307 [Bicyclus anynana]|uniref:Uncharacterized protein LOC128199307 n=1 Tax=Bicyclus anynana TaxID=110368 RepID=A0ABM3LYU9_BICAN|nr:uncharacterized protein LOC128199307 [Bicyclus anynana]